MRVCIVIVTYNGERYLPALFSSLQEHTNLSQHKVLVVDNASTDRTVELVKKFSEAQLIENQKNLGFAKGNNVGMHWAKEHGFDSIMLLNQDTRVSDRFLEPLLKIDN